MTTKTTKAERTARTEKRRINRELRQLRMERKPYLSGAWITNRGWWGVPYCDRPCGTGMCEGCASREYGLAEAAPLTARIEELKQELEELTAGPAPTRKATVITGRGEQLVMFV
ncbi:hypothetical protein [Streptomyces sp. SM1]|uniref:hypothetical protein n=1 Tax=Streptomyces sp. SM1 TaxID=402229 RepID=UPI000CD560AC|nr:hypothetical protein [Streptomyces sp. SM1]